MGNVDSKSDYSEYGGATHTYSVVAPVGSTDVSTVLSSVYATPGGADDAIVTCISCHRAHGTPYDDLLRWDYATCVSAGGNDECGCFACHTTKDDI
jgi:predicted CXXCH cytochrome family protein